MAESKSSDSLDLSNSRRDMWHKSFNRPVLICVTLIVIFVIFMARLVLGHVANVRLNRFSISRMGTSGYSTMIGSAGPGLMFKNNTNAATQDSIQGVVTNVNGNTLTIAGYGATNSVQTNSSTQYIGGSTPLVDDTVIVIGTINNDTFTASQISINP